MLKAITSSPSTSKIDGYFIHSHRFLARATEVIFWRTQAAIIRAMHAKRSLVLFVAHVHPECDLSVIVSFKTIFAVSWMGYE